MAAARTPAAILSNSLAEDPCAIDEAYGVFVSAGAGDAGDGTRGAPYRTIEEGIDRCEASGQACVRVRRRSGTIPRPRRRDHARRPRALRRLSLRGLALQRRSEGRRSDCDAHRGPRDGTANGAQARRLCNHRGGRNSGWRFELRDDRREQQQRRVATGSRDCRRGESGGERSGRLTGSQWCDTGYGATWQTGDLRRGCGSSAELEGAGQQKVRAARGEASGAAGYLVDNRDPGRGGLPITNVT